MNSKFPLLSAVSKLVGLGGWLTVIGGFGLAYYAGIYEPNLPQHTFGAENVTQLIGSGGLIGAGLLGVVCSELVGVAFAIEENTRRVADTAASHPSPPPTAS